MKKSRLKDYIGGWVAGNFEPSAYRTPDAEFAIKTHYGGEEWPNHAQKVATEINVILSGEMTLNGEYFHEGDVIVVEPGEFVKPVFLTDTKVAVMKVPSLPHDKIISDEKISLDKS